MFFRIKDGELSLTEAHLASDAFKAWAELPLPEAHKQPFGVALSEPRAADDGELTVCVSNHNPQMIAVSRDAIVARQDQLVDRLHLFWARDEDAGEDVIVAMTNIIASMDAGLVHLDDGDFAVIRPDSWHQMPENKELLRLFSSPAAAKLEVPNGRVVVPHSTIEGWSGLIVHDPFTSFEQSSGITMLSHCLTKEQLKQLEGPKGVRFKDIVAGKFTNEIYGTHLDPFENDVVVVRELVLTKDGGVYVLVELDDGVGGKKIIGKLYPHDEAVIHLDL